MKDIVGSPGTWSSVALRLSQCASAAAAVAAMDTASGYPYTAFWYLYTTMSLQLLWSFGTACLDIYSLKTKADLHDCRIVYRLLVVDWIYAILSLAAASASAGLTIFFERDVHFCRMYPAEMSCGRYELSVILAFINCASISTSAVSMFWLAVSL